MRHMPAAMLHGGGGVLLMMTTKFASQENIKIYQITKPMQQKPPPSQPYHTQINNTKSAPKSNMTTNAPLHAINSP